ncbi:universal stress protein [Stappia sp. F7233]|uniref:Universal stress protein n=1 Tax=Stappia albiluteola TaxID=2758565 RepID=A0A839AEZ7_9HYPH|nr:universal stress protein [Stappia albiluteola]MBA5777608.1 universal stress protein [Stappia albiluteola]
MYKTIMVPVDLAHAEKLEKAIATAADLAKHYNVPVCFVGVTTALPGTIAHSPAEFGAKLEKFAKAEGTKRGIKASSLVKVSHDPSIDLDKTLIEAAAEAEADLAVMASHVPGLPEHIFASNAGYLAAHAPFSVLVVR